MSWLVYLQYDEDSLALHSNAGLIRRAKKALDQVQLSSNTDDSQQQLEFQVEEEQVQLSPEGIAAATCSCPAQGCCKHILSSILWMQQHPAQFNGTTTPPTATSANTAVDTASEHTSHTNTASGADSVQATQMTLAAALALDSAAILKKSTKVTRRLAYQFFLDWQQHPEHCQIDIQADKICFLTELSPHKVQLFPTLGFAGMLSDLPSKQQAAVHLACIAYLFHHHHIVWAWPDDLLQNAAEQNIPIQLETEDLALINELQQITQHFMHQGLSHIAHESVLALHILNMQARAQNLPRLAAELRQLHGLMRQFLSEDDHQVDENQAFDQLAYFYAYLAALLANQQYPEQLQQLKGSSQRDYQQQQFAHLIPLGCEWWQLDSGARGLSLYYWDAEQQQHYEVTQARANHLDSTFDKNSAAQSGIWGSNIDYLLQHQLELTQAKMSDNNRLSASSETRFIEKAEFKQLDVEQLKQPGLAIDDWQQLDHLIRPHSSVARNMQRYVLLRHQDIEKPELNEVEQCFECRIIDQHGHSLKLSMPVESHYENRLKHFNSLIFTAKPVATLVRIDLSQHRARLIPCSVILEKKDGLHIFSLDYHYPPRPPKANVFELITGRIEKMLKQKKQWQAGIHHTPLELLLLHSQSFLAFYANIGRAKFDPSDQEKLIGYRQQFEDLGLQLIAQQFDQLLKTNNLAHGLLQSRHLLIQLQRLQYRFELESQTMSF
ncbi:SWIM zinc finger family protein [Acinetobacter rudis]|uniref:SWIM zinc finger family protein n=1 Tax=Acinetobacter rudis TaxID=632955 RepID=A0AAW8J9I4_9GAMM|nr:SWIM zinc finger family protein [Acinetobacter rudis]MDQ8936425.1 SWIM zinc finger family protein [Acinetobacter rudis]MDQ9018711.1 SWIM zinc finger family protein [Acinetobacter rudis]